MNKGIIVLSLITLTAVAIGQRVIRDECSRREHAASNQIIRAKEHFQSHAVHVVSQIAEQNGFQLVGLPDHTIWRGGQIVLGNIGATGDDGLRAEPGFLFVSPPHFAREEFPTGFYEVRFWETREGVRAALLGCDGTVIPASEAIITSEPGGDLEEASACADMHEEGFCIGFKSCLPDEGGGCIAHMACFTWRP